MSIVSDEIRKNFKASDDVRDAGLTTPDDIIRYDDIVYGKESTLQMLDVYRPKNREGEVLPVIISVHGGGWVYGDKERYQYYAMSLAQRGFAVINFSYRLAPEWKFPSSLEDCNLVFSWMTEHAAQFGLDTEHVFAVGDSAGAHMLALYSAIVSDETYASQYRFTVPRGWKLCAVALNCGIYRISDADPETNEALMKDLLPNGGTKEEYELISPVNHITKNYPPVFLMSAEDDFLKRQISIIIPVLLENNIPFRAQFYCSKETKLSHVFHCNMYLKEAARCNGHECEFFMEYCE